MSVQNMKNELDGLTCFVDELVTLLLDAVMMNSRIRSMGGPDVPELAEALVSLEGCLILLVHARARLSA